MMTMMMMVVVVTDIFSVAVFQLASKVIIALSEQTQFSRFES